MKAVLKRIAKAAFSAAIILAVVFTMIGAAELISMGLGYVVGWGRFPRITIGLFIVITVFNLMKREPK